MNVSDERWQELRRLVEADDGLPVRATHDGSIDKLFWWSRYLDATTTAMVGRPRWPKSVAYVDLFAGPGVLCVENARYPGSPLLAANSRKQFEHLIFCEKKFELAAALEARLDHSPAAGRFSVLVGDCNEKVDDVVDRIPTESLAVAFVDPTGLHARFETLCTLCAGRRVDLLILVPTEMDIHRNIETYYLPSEWSKLDEVLGHDCDWREKYMRIPIVTRRSVSEFILQSYREQLERHLGYDRFDDEVIYHDRKPIYRILFASKHDLGLHFWRIAKSRARLKNLLPLIFD